MPSYKQRKTEVRFELRNRAADMRLADAKRLRCACHPAVTHHGAKQVDMGGVHHASFAWKYRLKAFDSMERRAVKLQ